ncbi:MAG: hypothetical protein ACNS60_00925 [Candidatus Cyclobacteriaceae bacterium M2_1C_046]
MGGIKDILGKIKNRIKMEYRVIFGPEGKDKLYKSTNAYETEQEAKEAFNKSVEKLFDVETWSDLPGATSKFELYNAEGKRKKGEHPSVGDHLRILIPGPMPENWVEVINIEKKENEVYFTVSPDYDPQDKTRYIEHFFKDKATSTFKVERESREIRGYEIGKSEDINNKGLEAGDRKILNTITAETGWVIFQKLQWRKLTEYLVHQIELDH